MNCKKDLFRLQNLIDELFEKLIAQLQRIGCIILLKSASS